MKNKYFSINELDTPITELPKITPEYEPGESPRELLEKQIATLEKSQKDMEQLLYSPEEYWEQFKKLNEAVVNRNKDESTKLLSSTAVSLGKILQESALMFPKL